MTRRLRVLNAECRDYSVEARAELLRFAELVEDDLDRPDLLHAVGGCDVLIVRLGHRVDEEVMQAGQSLRAVVSATTGLDHIDVEAARRRGVQILSLKGETAFLDTVTATAEHTWALLLALVRRLPDAVNDVRAGNWQRDNYRGCELAGRTLGVIGYGRLGKMVARYGVAFGMRVLVNDSVLPRTLPAGMEACSLDALLAAAEVVTIHVPLSHETRHLIDAGTFKRMRAGTVIVNTARGEIIDPDALLAALADGGLAGAALDVVPGEQPGFGTMAAHPLVKQAQVNANLIITPHIGGATWDSMRKTEVFMAQRLHEWARRHGFAVEG